MARCTRNQLFLESFTWRSAGWNTTSSQVFSALHEGIKRGEGKHLRWFVRLAARRQEKHGQIVLPQLTNIPDGRVSEELCASAATMANNLGARAIFVYTRRGYMANFLSRCRPDCPVFAFTGAAWPVAPAYNLTPTLTHSCLAEPACPTHHACTRRCMHTSCKSPSLAAHVGAPWPQQQPSRSPCPKLWGGRRGSDVSCLYIGTRSISAPSLYMTWRKNWMSDMACLTDKASFSGRADQQDVRQRLNLRWGVMPFRLDFAPDPEENVDRTFRLLKRRDLVQPGDLVVVVSDIRPDSSDASVVRSVQIRRVPA